MIRAMQYIEAGGIADDLSQTEAGELSPEIFAKTGVFVVRGAIPPATMARWQEAWQDFYAGRLADAREIDLFNPVVVHEQVPQPLAEIHRCPELLDQMERLYPDLALYTQRFVIKDRRSRGPVFLHHDYGYDLGWPEKASAFVPLSPTNDSNGGLIFYPGTHLLGYLGDVGELDREILDPAWPAFQPSLEPGDVAVMHECTWHASSPHVSGPDRVLVQITYQPASDPSGIALLRGRWRTDARLGDLPRERLFKRCRASRLRELQSEVDLWRSGRKP